MVYNNRRERGKEFDQWFLWEMIESYDNWNQNAARDNLEAEVVNAAPTIVYNEFNMQLLIAHAQHREQQPPAREEDDADRVQAV